MMIVSYGCALNILNNTSSSVNDASRSIIDDSRVTLHIVASFTIVICIQHGQTTCLLCFCISDEEKRFYHFDTRRDMVEMDQGLMVPGKAHSLSSLL